jgi:hypothetical protein
MAGERAERAEHGERRAPGGEQASTPEPLDPLHLRALADATVQRAADALRRQLEDVARRIDPFPPFPGAMFAYGIEVDPPPARDGGPGGAAGSPDLGCVILGNDGQLYELQIGLDHDQVALGGDHVAARHEELIKLDLPAADFIPLAHRALLAAAGYIEAHPEARPGASS